MQSSDIPNKFPVPFANSAGSGFIRPIPVTSQIGIQNGAASLPDGFPPNAFVPKAAGGTPPFGQDFNGLLNQVTAWERWLQAGAPVSYDATFQAAIGGYPKGSVIQSATQVGLSWLSLADENLTNPDSGGGGWIVAPAPMFPSSLTPNGWKKYPDPTSPEGYFIEQWCTSVSFSFAANGGSGQQNLTATFPLAFEHAVLQVGIQSLYPSESNINVFGCIAATSLTATSVAVNNGSAFAQTIHATVFAKGY